MKISIPEKIKTRSTDDSWKFLFNDLIDVLTEQQKEIEFLKDWRIEHMDEHLNLKPHTAMRSTGKKKESIIIECQWCGASHSEDKPFRHYDGCHKDIKPQENVKKRLKTYLTNNIGLNNNLEFIADRILAIVKGE